MTQSGASMSSVDAMPSNGCHVFDCTMFFNKCLCFVLRKKSAAVGFGLGPWYRCASEEFVRMPVNKHWQPLRTSKAWVVWCSQPRRWTAQASSSKGGGHVIQSLASNNQRNKKSVDKIHSPPWSALVRSHTYGGPENNRRPWVSPGRP